MQGHVIELRSIARLKSKYRDQKTRQNSVPQSPVLAGRTLQKMYYANKIRQSLSMKEVCAKYGVELNRYGFAKCPYHGEKTASFKVYPDSSFHCFGCGAHGNGVIDFVMLLFHLDFHEACERLNQDFSLGLPLDNKPTLRQQREFETIMKARQKKLASEKRERETLEKAYHDALDEYVRLDAQKRIYEPQADDTELHPKYVEALQKIAKADYLLSVAEDELYDFRRKHNS